MRDVKFRGLDYQGKWVYGDLITKPVHYACVILENGVINHSVDPSSVSQYTGLQDINGKEIYFGDLMKPASGNLFEVIWHESEMRIALKHEGMIYNFNVPLFEVVGNTFENRVN